MKNKTFGNIIESEPLYITTPQTDINGDVIYDKDTEEPVLINKKNFNRFHSNGIEFYNQEDKISARDFNRPIRQLHEDAEDIFDILQTMSKMVLGDKKTSVIPGLLEEFNPEGLKIGRFFTPSEQYIRIPTGAFIINKEDRIENSSESNEDFYNLYEEDEYKKDYIKRDRNSTIVYNRPRLEKFERELGEHFCVDLNEQSNNIVVDYMVKDKEDGNGKEILYTCEVTKTRYNVNNEEIEDTYGYVSKVNNNKIQKYFNIFDLVQQASINDAISSFVVKDGLYSLEEMIPIDEKFISRFENSSDSVVEKKCKIYYNMDSVNFEKDAESLTQNYSLIFDGSDTTPNDNQIHLFDLTIVYNKISGTFIAKDQELMLNTLNRSVLEVKNINVSNNYITVDNESWHRCRKTELADMIIAVEKNKIISREDENFK